MYKNRRVVVVIPTYNEQKLIGRVLETIPEFVDLTIVVDDCSKDSTVEKVNAFVAENPKRFQLLRQEKNQGPGAAVSRGYREALEAGADVVAVMNGDAQMPPEDLDRILDPVVDGEVDYAKANRLFTGEAWKRIPKVRYLGNAFLSLMTKIASGNWQIADSQAGYTAISARALKRIGISDLYPRYGYPNHMLIKINGFGFKVKDIPSQPIYGIGERSSMRIPKVVPTVTWLLIRGFFWRLKEKYVIRDFHPLVLFYAASFMLWAAGFGLLGRVIWKWTQVGYVSPIGALATGFCLVSALQFTLFAMWFDMEYDRR